MLGRDQAREDLQAAPFDDEIMEAAPEGDPAHLDHAQAAALGAVIDGELLEVDDSMRDRMELEVVLHRRQVVEQDDRAVSGREEVLERQHLAPMPSSDQPWRLATRDSSRRVSDSVM